MPEEFAAAYRAAYERALAAQSEGVPDEEEPATRDTDTDELPVRRGRLVVGTHRTEAYDDEPTMFEKISDSPWFVPLLLALLALLLVLGAYAVGRTFADKVNNDSGPSSEPSVVMSERGAKREKQPVTTQAPGKGAWDGAVERITGVRAKADCTSAPGRDASGAKVSYAAANLTDGVADTTWRCDGTAIGKKITLQLPRKTAIGEVGLIPGYAKTDETSGADRYAQNNRVTRVRWTIGDIVVDQKLGRSSTDRSLRLLRVPRSEADPGAAGDHGRGQGTAQHDRDQRGPARQGRLTGGVEHHRDRSVVGQTDLHLGAEHPLLDVGSGLLEARAHGLVERLGHLARSGCLPGRPAPLAGVAVQRELADHQHRGAEVSDRAFVAHDPQVPDLAHHPGDLVGAVVVGDAEEYDESRAPRSGRPPRRRR